MTYLMLSDMLGYWLYAGRNPSTGLNRHNIQEFVNSHLELKISNALLYTDGVPKKYSRFDVDIDDDPDVLMHGHNASTAPIESLFIGKTLVAQSMVELTALRS